MLPRVFDAFLRALGHVFLPRVIGMTLLPLLVMSVVALLLAWLGWQAAVAWMQAALQGWSPLGWAEGWLNIQRPGGLALLLAPLFVVLLATPVIVLASLVVVSLLLTPALTRLVAERRFANLARLGGGSLAASLAWSTGSLLLAVLALVLTLPLWLIPPLVLVLPPLIWGWLTCRVFAYDVLAEHASAEERHELLRRHRWPLLGIGVACGYLGALPSLLWAASGLALIFAPILVVVSVWLYTLVFAFAACWFAHYLLAALQQWRSASPAAAGPIVEALP